MPHEAADDGREAMIQRAAMNELLRNRSPGERIRFLRIERRMSQTDLADAVKNLGASCSGKWKISRWEAGMRPREQARKALAQVLGVEESVLFNQ